LERPLRIGQHREPDRLAKLHPWGIRLAHERDQPHRGEIADHEDWIACPGADVLTRTGLALHDRAWKRSEDGRFRRDLSSLLEAIDFRIGLAEKAQPVTHGFKRRLRRAKVILRARQIGL